MRSLRLLTTSLMVLTALGCALWVLTAQGGRWSVQLDILTHFAPMLLALSLLPAIYGLVFERGGARLLLVGVSAVTIAASGLLVAPEYLRPASPPAPDGAPCQIKLIQFNAWERNGRQAETIRWLRAQDPDILVVEEASIIAPALKRAFRGYHVSCGDCSVMILSKARPVARDVPVPPAAAYDDPPPIAGATFRDSRGEFSVFGTHYTWPIHSRWQQAQGRVISGLLNRFPKERLILTGDFNSTPWSFSRRREDAMFGLERRTRALFSWPADRSVAGLGLPFALLPIDHVYAGPGWRTVRAERGPRLGSDHYPVIVTLAPSP
ncbi:MAG: endonuclease [Phenylobacterium sp.]|uniref:endonuclease/exonuclease/phosphatase family protein n=1 Tax=Phenylobacterium sp. TaxID=1871053 RepID=UPI0025ECB6E0|nr:endonuclease/exonuclease/phosphatase family protein [Phenylobacterium sp.]MBA4011538.1 endonuclease [Phenylobacterium sp.]